MGTLWKCPTCGTILQKGSQEARDIIGRRGIVVGTATCGNCGAQFSQSGIYSRKYDVDGEPKKWWQFWKYAMEPKIEGEF